MSKLIALEKTKKKEEPDKFIQNEDSDAGSESDLESVEDDAPIASDDEKSIDNDDDDLKEDGEEENNDNGDEKHIIKEFGDGTTMEWDDNMMNDFEPEDFSEDENEDYEDELQKFKNYQTISSLQSQHPEIQQMNYDEIIALTKVVKNKKGIIIDPLHTTMPILTKYEKARLIGSRAEQINRGAAPAIPVDENIIDGRTIAIMEFEKKAIPFIIARPLPSGAVEYWKMQDLEVL
jgi:DNA-directed RNA polymerases I, II, and III subunit RPABC2